MAPLNELSDTLLRTFSHRLHGPARSVSDPSRDPEGDCLAPGRLPEPNALHAPFNDEPDSDVGQ
jgi:hypothetical protein